GSVPCSLGDASLYLFARPLPSIFSGLQPCLRAPHGDGPERYAAILPIRGGGLDGAIGHPGKPRLRERRQTGPGEYRAGRGPTLERAGWNSILFLSPIPREPLP